MEIKIIKARNITELTALIEEFLALKAYKFENIKLFETDAEIALTVIFTYKT
ncbi:MAG: hypothetical protein QNK36_06460 [Colwellia sp.]|nr:hypothetical protein [Colwellia sp.]